MTTERNIVIHQGQAFELSLDYAGAPGRSQRMHIRPADETATIVQALSHNGAANARVIYNDSTQKLDITIGATVSAAWVVLADRVEWKFDIEDYDPADEDDTIIPFRGKSVVYGNRTRPEDATPSPQMPNGDSRYTRFDGDQGLTPEQMAQAQINILGEEYAPGGGSGDVVGPASATDGRIAEFDGTTGKLIRQGSYTITTLLAAAWARASHTGTQLASTISDFATAAIAAVTWSTITGKPSTFDPSAHKTSHATGGGDALTASDIGAATAGHDHTGTYQPLATVLTNTTAAFTTAQESKLSGIEAAADVTDAGNVGTAIDGATAKTTPVDADTVALIDSAAGNVLKKLSWANIKATAKTYFDTLYQAASATLTTWAGITPAAGVGTFLATPSSANLATAVTDETGSGALVFATSPTLVTPALGTPSSGTLTNCTGLPAAGSDTQVTFNDAGTRAGNAGLTFNKTNKTLDVGGGTVTASDPILHLTQTLNNAAVVFTCFKLDITDTASNANSYIAHWTVDGVNRYRFFKNGDFYAAGGITAATSVNAGSTVTAADAGFFAFTSNDVRLYRDAAATLNLRNGTTAQKLRVSGTYTDINNRVNAALSATSTAVTLAAETAGTGADDVPVVISPAGLSQVEIGNGVQFTEMTAPSAPAANKVILYAVDNGAGKTQLMALFSSGAAQQVAIQP